MPSSPCASYCVSKAGKRPRDGQLHSEIGISVEEGRLPQRSGLLCFQVFVIRESHQHPLQLTEHRPVLLLRSAERATEQSSKGPSS